MTAHAHPARARLVPPHGSPRSSERVRTGGTPFPARLLLRAGVTLVGVGALAVAGAGTAMAAGPTDTLTRPTTSGSGAAESTGSGTVDPELLRGPKNTFDTEMRNTGELVFGPLKRLPLHPLANTAVDPLDNTLGTQVGDFREVSTEGVTEPLANGGSLEQLPVVGPATGLLPG